MGFFIKGSIPYDGKPAYTRFFWEGQYQDSFHLFIYWRRRTDKWYVGTTLGADSRALEAPRSGTESPLDPSLKWSYYDSRSRTTVYDPSIKANPAHGGKKV